MSAEGNGFTAKTFAFFEGLEQDNSKTYMDANRDDFDRYVHGPFAALLDEVTARLAGSEMPLRGGAATMFRINRDLRFTKDKRPYSESVSGLLTETGTKDESGKIAYVQLSSSGGMATGGMWKPKAAQLAPVRQRIIDDADQFDEVLAGIAERGLELDSSDSVKTMPRGFGDYGDHRHAAVLRMKSLLLTLDIPKSAFLDDTAAERVAEHVMAMAPLNEFIAKAQ